MIEFERHKLLFTHILIQIGVIGALALTIFVVSGCAKKNTNPPQGSLAFAQTAQPGDPLNKIAPKDSVEDMEELTSSNKNADNLLAQILQDKSLRAYRLAFQKKNNATCTLPSRGQIHWDCKSATQCQFSIELTCVSNVSANVDNNLLKRLSVLGEADAAKMTYKLSDPAKTASESKVVTVNFEK